MFTEILIRIYNKTAREERRAVFYHINTFSLQSEAKQHTKIKINGYRLLPHGLCIYLHFIYNSWHNI